MKRDCLAGAHEVVNEEVACDLSAKPVVGTLFNWRSAVKAFYGDKKNDR